MTDKLMNHEELVKKVFWQQLEKKAPKTTQASVLAEGLFNDLWKDIALGIVGKDVDLNAYVRDGVLRATYPWWLLMGVISVVAWNMVDYDMDKLLSKSETIGQLDSKVREIEKQLKATNSRMKDICKDIEDLRKHLEPPPSK